MNSSNEDTSPEYVRFKNRPEIKSRLLSIKECLVTLNKDFINEPSFNGTSVYALDKSNPGLAGVIATVDAAHINPNRLQFSKDEVQNRYVVVGSTTLRYALETNTATYSQSLMNPHEHCTYTIPLSHNDEQLGALQYAIDTTTGSFLGDYDIEQYVEKQDRTIQFITSHLKFLMDSTPSLPRSLALKDSNTPNSYVVRLDIHDSTGFINDEASEADFHEYLDVLKSKIMKFLEDNEIAKRYKFNITFDDQADGMNIFLKFNKDQIERANETDYINYILHTEIAKIVEAIKQEHAFINTGYPFKPQLSIAEGSAFIRYSSLNKPIAKELWDLAGKTKK